MESQILLSVKDVKPTKLTDSLVWNHLGALRRYSELPPE